MSERSGRDDVQETGSTQQGLEDGNHGRRRRRRRTRRLLPEEKNPSSLPESIERSDKNHSAGERTDSESTANIDAGLMRGPPPAKKGRRGENLRPRQVSAANADCDTSGRMQSRHRRSKDSKDPHTRTPDHRYKSEPRKSSAYAALDLGTNNCRLLVAVPRHKGRFRVIDGFSRIVRLGEGLSQTGRLSDAAMDRAVEALKICATKLASRELKQQRLIATEACRQAENGEVFLERVRNETGLELEIVTRETEARLAAEGCGSLMDQKSDAAVMFDIGGGSTELILVKGRRRHRKRIADRIVGWTSLPMGVVTLAERFGGKEVTADQFSKMVKSVIEEISSFDGRAKLDASFQSGYAHLLGTSGTVTTLAGIHLGLERYDRKKVDGLWLKSHEVDKVIDELLGMNYRQRAENPCIGSERADLVLAGCAILEAIREIWPSERLRVADRGLREGLLAEMMNADGVWRYPRKHRTNFRRKPRHSE
ncbi:MAG: Ppx/GppA phosphatase family protein [Rhizobiaceae bacterium]